MLILSVPHKKSTTCPASIPTSTLASPLSLSLSRQEEEEERRQTAKKRHHGVHRKSQSPWLRAITNASQTQEPKDLPLRPAAAANPPEENPDEKKPSKKGAKKDAKKEQKKSKPKPPKGAAPANPKAAKGEPAAPSDPEHMFKEGFLHSVYNERPVGNNVVTRFPPEPNGYLHIGHSKAIAINFGFAKYHGGKCYLRYDDTNPSGEEQEYFESIKDIVEWLGFEPVAITHSSDHFDRLYELAEELIRKDGAYMCHCSSKCQEIPVDLSMAYIDGIRRGRNGSPERLW